MAGLEAREQFPCNICKISIIRTAICLKFVSQCLDCFYAAEWLFFM